MSRNPREIYKMSYFTDIFEVKMTFGLYSDCECLDGVYKIIIIIRWSIKWLAW